MNTTNLPKKGLKTRPYSMDMNKDIVTLPKKGLKTKPYNIGMKKRDLEKLTKGQLIKLLLKQQAQKPRNSVKHKDIIPPPEQFRDGYKPVPPPRTGKWENVKPKPIPRKSVKQMVKEYEEIIQPPEQFRDVYKPIPKPRTDIKIQNARRPPKPTRKPPQPPKPMDEFNFDDDIFQTENTSLRKFKIISIRSRENKKFKSYTNEFEIKILKKLNNVGEIYDIFHEIVKLVKKRRKLRVKIL